MKRYRHSNAEDCISLQQDGNDQPITFNGSFCVPASDIFLGGVGGSTDDTITGVLVLTAGPFGAHQNLSPNSMRSMAQALTRMANLADANSARMAAAAIAAAGKPRS